MKKIIALLFTAALIPLFLSGTALPDDTCDIADQNKDGFRKADVIWVPTPAAVIDRMLQMASIKKGDVLYDLGCGDGRIVAAAAKKYGIKAWGFEIDPYLVDEARKLMKDEGVEHLATIERADIFTLDLSKASVITLYLLPELNAKLLPQLAECRPGTRIIAHDFGIPGTEPDRMVRMGGSIIYIWKTPLKGAKTRKVPGNKTGK